MYWTKWKYLKRIYSTFKAFAVSINLSENEEIKEILKNKVIASIGPVTTKTIEKYGLKVGIEPKKYTEDRLFDEILTFVTC